MNGIKFTSKFTFISLILNGNKVTDINNAKYTWNITTKNSFKQKNFLLFLFAFINLLISTINNIIKAKNLGYKIEVHYIGVESIEIAKERIAYRVEHGGHGIPNADVERRYYESFEHLRKIMNICDVVILYDNTEAFNRFAIFHNGEAVMLSKELPDWYGKYLK